MSRVKFNVNTEYAYIQNFKVLQNCFTKHGIDRIVPVEALVKCKMQDNLEFLQWSKRFWDQYFPGGEYDALARRKGASGPAPSAAPAARAPVSSAGGARRTPVSAPARTAGSAGRVGGGAASSAATAALQQENAALKESVMGLEKERDFYFEKLREIEMLIQQIMEADPEIQNQPENVLNQVTAILYSTEEGFEIPQEGELIEGEGVAAEEETF